MLTREELLKPAPRRIKEITLADGRKTYIRSLSERERGDYESFPWDTDDRGLVRMDPARIPDQHRLLIVFCVCNASGDPILQRTDLRALQDLDGALVADLYAQCREHAGLDGLAKAEATEAKN